MVVKKARNTEFGSTAPRGGANEMLGETLVNEFLPYIRLRIRGIRISGCDADDLIQEGLIGLFNAASTYSADKGASFRTYAITCIDNRVSTACRAAGSKGNLPLADYESLEDEERPSGQNTPEELAVIKSDYSDIIDIIDRYLSEYEKSVLAMHLNGYGYGAIASALGTTQKSADNALQRARRKLRSQLKP